MVSVVARLVRMMVAIAVAVTAVGVFIGPSVAASSRPADRRIERKLFADIYRPGQASSLLDKAIKQATKAEASPSPQPPNCGEYQCLYDDGYNRECVNDGETHEFPGGFEAMCDCDAGGNCYWDL